MKKLLLIFIFIFLVAGLSLSDKTYYLINKSKSYQPLLNVSNKLIKDPFVIKVNRKYYMLYTYGNTPWDADIGYATSYDGQHWYYRGVLVDHRKAWGSNESPIWAPTVIKQNNSYYLFVSGVIDGGYKMGYFSSSKITGEWKWDGLVTDENNTPLEGLDPFIVKHRGVNYFYCSGAKDNQIELYRSKSFDNWKYYKTVLKPSFDWEGSILEAPKLVRYNQKYYLFYGANDSESNQRIGLATSESITGPFEKKGKLKLSYPGSRSGAISHPDLIKIGQKWNLYVSISEQPDYFIFGYQSNDLIDWK
jgi:predicted GH43/DUF377 family glycosyl hydrolase